MLRYFFKTPVKAYAFQDMLKRNNIDSELVNNFKGEPFFIKVNDRFVELSDELYGKFLLS